MVFQHLEDQSEQDAFELECLANDDEQGIYLNDADLEFLSQLHFIRKLSLPHNKAITDLGLRHLSNNLASSLRHLDLTGCDKITDDGLEHLSKLSFLQYLNLMYCKKISDRGLEHLSKISSLQRLRLCDCWHITDEGLRHLSKLTSLQHLDLSMCGDGITDAGLIYLSELSLLQYLSICLCGKITDAGLEHLSKLSLLRYLDVSESEVTDSGLQLLVNMPSLHPDDVLVFDTAVSEEGHAAFRKQLQKNQGRKPW